MAGGNKCQVCPGSLLAVLAEHPAEGGFLAEGLQTVGVTDPILIRHRLPERLGLEHQLLERGVLLSDLVEAILNGLSAVAVRAVGIHRAEGQSLDGEARCESQTMRSAAE